MAKKQKELSHEEVWDDSGLIQSWDAAYEEYKRYHSIAARGERIEDVLAAENSPDASIPVDGAPAHAHHEDSLRRTEESVDEGELADDQVVPDAMETEADETGHRTEATPSGLSNRQPIPQAMAGNSTSDPALKNLMMSWYWAGYYTGYYEGQQQAGRATGNTA